MDIDHTLICIQFILQRHSSTRPPMFLHIFLKFSCYLRQFLHNLIFVPQRREGSAVTCQHEYAGPYMTLTVLRLCSSVPRAHVVVQYSKQSPDRFAEETRDRTVCPSTKPLLSDGRYLHRSTSRKSSVMVSSREKYKIPHFYPNRVQ